jgi:hypothetical protein
MPGNIMVINIKYLSNIHLKVDYHCLSYCYWYLGDRVSLSSIGLLACSLMQAAGKK